MDGFIAPANPGCVFGAEESDIGDGSPCGRQSTKRVAVVQVAARDERAWFEQLRQGCRRWKVMPVVEWIQSHEPVPYDVAVATMEDRAAAIRAGTADEAVWLLEHPPIYTAGTSADPRDLMEPTRFPLHRTGRGGRHTYHGPGQRVVYLMLDVGGRGRDVRAFVAQIESWIIATLDRVGVRGETRDGRVGVWVVRHDRPLALDGNPREDKIAAMGIRLRRWVSLHGLSINVDPDLGHFAGIVPCGIADHGVTSLVDLGLPVTLAELDMALHATFPAAFPPRRTAPCDRAAATEASRRQDA